MIELNVIPKMQILCGIWRLNNIDKRCAQICKMHIHDLFLAVVVLAALYIKNSSTYLDVLLLI